MFLNVSNSICCFQTPDDPLHQINLGLWVHLLEAIIYGIQQTLSETRPNGSQVLTKELVKSVFSELGDRLAAQSPDTTGIYLAEKVKVFAAEMVERRGKGKSKVCVIEARQQYQLMLVSLFLLVETFICLLYLVFANNCMHITIVFPISFVVCS
jgi:cell shape-determining protein MreD